MNGIREENLLGGQKVIVGKITEDLILETLGKVYIRNGRNFTLLNDIIQKVEELYSGIDSGNVEIGSSVYFIENLDEMGEYPDGSLVFDKQTEYLYMIVDGQPILLIEAKTNKTWPSATFLLYGIQRKHGAKAVNTPMKAVRLRLSAAA